MIIYLWRYDKTSGRFVKSSVIDYALSVIWVTRFNECGEFEICLPATKDFLNLINKNEIMFTRDERESAMLLEKIQISTNEEYGGTLILSGRSIESILARRVVSKQTLLSGTAENGIRTLLLSNAVEPTDTDRKINPLVLGNIESDQWGDEMSKQVTGENLLTAIIDICQTYGYGFKITNNEDRNIMVFDLYKGTDVSASVVFSSDYGNLVSTEYVVNYSNSANLVYVAGEGEGSERKIVFYESDDADEYQLTDIFRKEYWQDERDCSSTTETGQLLSTEYLTLLRNKGKERYYSELKPTAVYSGEIISSYEYGVDYNLGDTVSIVNDYGIKAFATVKEITEVEDENGYSIVPTLSEWMVM